MKARLPVWLLASLVATVLLSGYSLFQRFQAEALNRAVGLVADADTIQTLGTSQGLSFAESLAKLKSAGLTGIVLPEETVADLVTAGRASVAPGELRLTDNDQVLRARVARGLSHRFGIFVIVGGATLPIGSLDPTLARSSSIGIDPALAAEAKSQGLLIVARLSNPPGATDKYVAASLGWVAELGASVFLPQGDQVLGRRDALPATLDALRKHSMLYATPEFAKIGGDANIVGEAPELVVRLHSAQTAELDKLGLPEVIERYGKAAAERNQRILLIRPISNAAAAPLDSFGDLVAKIKSQITKEGYTAAKPHAFADSNVPVWVFVAIALTTLPAFFWMSQQLGRFGLALLGIAAILALGVVSPAARGPFALLCAMVYPMIAFMSIEPSQSPGPVGLGRVLLAFARLSAISLIGGLCVGGLLNGLPFFVKADVFEGVKVAHFLPIGLVGLYFFVKLGDAKSAMRSPIFWGQAVLGVGLLVAFAFMASRTGNDNPAGVSGLELKVRGLLDQFLYVRPRTKEFLVGHPAMVLALGMALSGRFKGGWLALALMVGAIGQTSVVNTMCHLHTPLTVSLARIGVGLLVGGILGAIGWGVLSRFPATRQN